MQHTLGCFSPKTDIFHARVLSMLALYSLHARLEGEGEGERRVLNRPQQRMEQDGSQPCCLCSRLATVDTLFPVHRSAAYSRLTSRSLCMAASGKGQQQQQSRSQCSPWLQVDPWKEPLPTDSLGQLLLRV